MMQLMQASAIEKLYVSIWPTFFLVGLRRLHGIDVTSQDALGTIPQTSTMGFSIVKAVKANIP
jgi:hypothetical protein